MTPCPSCGFELDPQATSRCPRCGRNIAAPVASTLSAPQFHPYPPQPSPIAWAAPTDEQRVLENAAPAATPVPAPTVTGYAGGYPIAPTTPTPGYPQPPLPPLPERKRSTGRTIGIIALIVVILGACTGGAFLGIRALQQPASPSPSSAAAPLSTPVIVYGNTFASQDNGWFDDGSDSCFLKDDGYHIRDSHICFAPIGTESDVDIRVDVKQISGPGRFPLGIAFRATEDNTAKHSYYIFEITTNGFWELLRCANTTCDRLINYENASAIHTGLGSLNSLEVYAKGSQIVLFINGQMVDTFDDTTYSFGKIGLLCGDSSECVFTNLLIGVVY